MGASIRVYPNSKDYYRHTKHDLHDLEINSLVKRIYLYDVGYKSLVFVHTPIDRGTQPRPNMHKQLIHVFNESDLSLFEWDKLIPVHLSDIEIEPTKKQLHILRHKIWKFLKPRFALRIDRIMGLRHKYFRPVQFGIYHDSWHNRISIVIS